MGSRLVGRLERERRKGRGKIKDFLQEPVPSGCREVESRKATRSAWRISQVSRSRCKTRPTSSERRLSVRQSCCRARGDAPSPRVGSCRLVKTPRRRNATISILTYTTLTCRSPQFASGCPLRSARRCTNGSPSNRTRDSSTFRHSDFNLAALDMMTDALNTADLPLCRRATEGLKLQDSG